MVFCHIRARTVDKVVKHFVLVAEDVVVNIEHFWRLSSQDKRLHETSHWTHVVRQLPGHLKCMDTTNWRQLKSFIVIKLSYFPSNTSATHTKLGPRMSPTQVCGKLSPMYYSNKVGGMAQ